MKELAVLLGGQCIGTITEDRRGDLAFGYEDGYRADRSATPLSRSMPLDTSRHGDEVVRPFLWGLLPDNDQVIGRWGRDFQVSSRNPFALLQHVGADCAGAVQLVPPEAVDGLLAGAGGVEWIDEAEIGARLRRLRRDPTAWHLTAATTTGHFSLAGAQAKTALHFDPDSGRWGDPYGAVPTTHILKPAVTGLDDHDLNEHICLRAAEELDIDAALTDVVSFAGERAIVVTRYDRLRLPDGAVQRVHQEDMCQALGVPPDGKYQNEGGPSPERILELLRRSTTTSVGDVTVRFLDALAFNWLIAGTDAHAKNYSILLSGPRVRLAPLYDVASALPYDDMYLSKLKLAMRIGGEYGVTKIQGRHWRRFAEATGLDPDEVVHRIGRIAAYLPAAFAEAVRSDSVVAVGGDLPERLLQRVTARAQRCQDDLAVS